MSSFDTQILLIPADEIHIGINVKNIRSIFDDIKLIEFAETIHRDGLMNPLTIMESDDGTGNLVTELVAGERRFRAIKYIQAKMDDTFYKEGIPCVQYTGTTHDAEFVNALENLDRETVDDVDVSAWLFNRVQDGVTQSELGKKLHRKLQWVNFRVTFFERSCDELKEALRNNVISFSAAYELAKNLDHDDQKKWIQKAIKFNRKISLEEAQRAGNNEKTERPGKKTRNTLKGLAGQHLDIEFCRGVEFALKWVDGDLAEDELKEAIDLEVTARAEGSP